jgi:lipopolysaccharide/colanic/teichoic acid biosynthesis glycosyltransferase
MDSPSATPDGIGSVQYGHRRVSRGSAPHARPAQHTLIAPLADLPAVRFTAEAVRETPREILREVPHEHDRSGAVSRAMNVSLALVAITALSPVLVIIGVAVKATSPGPVIYRQIRVGIDRRRKREGALLDRRGMDVGGRVFTMYKFRTMVVDAERDGVVWATQNDSRITMTGRVLRLSRLDELPQLFNVLFGDMNIVGPRPERPSIFIRLRDEIDSYALRQRARPGITGWAQINQGYDRDINDVRRKVAYDLDYIQRRSLWEDIRIMARTIPVMLFKRGAH